MKIVLPFIMALITGCATSISNEKMVTDWCFDYTMECVEAPEQVELPTYQSLRELPPAEVMPVVAVYQFADLTGQRKESENIALFSSAVTQGAHNLLIDSLKAAGAGDTGNGTWFRVVERGIGLDNLVRERQIIRSTRQEHNEGGPMEPLLFAGIILEGGIVGYDSNIETGGDGARWMGIGGVTSYRRDSVTVSLRAISTLTGEVLINVQTQKSILSVGAGMDVFRFLDMDTQLLELETGISFNESTTWAVRAAIESAVLAMIEQGDVRGFWKIDISTNTEDFSNFNIDLYEEEI